MNFMYGRYGFDQLSIALMMVGVVLSFFGSTFIVLAIIPYAFYIFALYRCFSRNIYARQKELGVFMKFWRPITQWFSFQKRKFADRKYYKYFKCPNCKQSLRAPKGRGQIMVTCQKCKKQFSTKV